MQAGVPQFNSIAKPPRVSTDPTGEELSPTRWLPFQMPIASSEHPGDLKLLSDVVTNQRFPQPPPWVYNLLVWLTEPRKIVYLLLLIYCRGYFKGYR